MIFVEKKVQKLKNIIITDLDGSLLNHSNFSFSEIRSELLFLLDSQTQIIPASSKTKAEMEMFCAELGRDLPFIYENGAGFQNINQITLEKSSKPFTLSPAAINTEKIWEIWCENVSDELKNQCLFSHDMNFKQQIDAFGLTGQNLENALAREFSFNFKFFGNQIQLHHLKKILNSKNLNAQHGGRLMTLSGKHDKADYCNFIRTRQKIHGFEPFLVGVGDSENDAEMLENCDLACIIPRPHKPLLSISLPPERTIVAGSVAPLGWLEAIKKALNSSQIGETLRYG